MHHVRDTEERPVNEHTGGYVEDEQSKTQADL